MFCLSIPFAQRGGFDCKIHFWFDGIVQFFVELDNILKKLKFHIIEELKIIRVKEVPICWRLIELRLLW